MTTSDATKSDKRFCANGCGTEITGCMGFVLVGTLLEYWAGIRPRERVYELCAMCAELLGPIMAEVGKAEAAG
jgi:hypothetical protein